MIFKKQDEFILGVNKAAFLDYFIRQPSVGVVTNLRTFNPKDLGEVLYPDLLIKTRAALEVSATELHWITYGIIRQRKTGKVLVYDRPAKNNGEVKLAGKRSIGIGGHVDFPDILTYQNQYIELLDTLYVAANREFKEEVSFVDARDQKPVDVNAIRTLRIEVPEHCEDPVEWVESAVAKYSAHLPPCASVTSLTGLLYDSSDAVGRQHIGFVTTLWIDGDLVPVSGEDQILNPRMMDIEDILAESDSLESWSQLLAYSIA